MEQSGPMIRMAGAFILVLIPFYCFSSSHSEGVEPHIEEAYRGLTLVKEENYAEALKAFEKSFALKPTASALFNIGMCFKAMARYVESIDTLKKYIEHSNADPGVVIDARAAVEEMESLIGRVVIEGAPVDAEVWVNGKTSAVTPLSAPIRLDPDRMYIIRVTKTGYLPFIKELFIAPGDEIAIEPAMTRQKAMLKVTCVDSGASVSIDGAASLAPCPYEEEIEPGLHRVRVSSPEQKDFISTIEALPGQTVLLSVTFEKKIEPVKRNADKTKSLIISGAVAGVLGIGSTAIGAVYGHKYNEALDRGNSAEYRLENNKSTSINRDLEIYNKAESDLPDFKNGAVIGFVTAGVLISTGAVLLGVGFTSSRKSKEISIVPGLNSITVEF